MQLYVGEKRYVKIFIDAIDMCIIISALLWTMSAGLKTLPYYPQVCLLLAHAKRNFAADSDLSVEMEKKITHQRSWDTIKNILVNVIGTFRNTARTVKQKFVRKSRTAIKTCHNASNSNHLT